MLLATRHDDELEAALADPEAADRAEIRLAVVMTGGVSLAVWIGGVVAEIYRAHKRVGLYKPLLDALRSDVTIDIVTGASAGGLNGVFLGAALSRQVDVEQFDGLRDVWLTAGSMIALLRDPYQRNPPSLLKGDAYLLVEIEKVLRGWLKWGKNQFKAGQQFDLVLTATTLAPDIVQRADDLGARIAEPVHRARFHFQASHFNAPAPDTLARQMALAARTSASFPGAFEPSYVGIGRDSAYADMAGIASFPQSMWAMDGGVLMNKPVAPALDLLRDRRSVRHGRRILLYVNPDPSDGAVTQEARRESVPTMASVISKALFSLPRVESIAADLAEVRTRNAKVLMQRDTRTKLLLDDELVGPTDLTGLAKGLHQIWRRRSGYEAVTRRLLQRFEEAGGDMSAAVQPNRSSSYLWQTLEEAMLARRIEEEWLAPEFPAPADLDVTDEWGFGFEALEYMCSVALDLLKRARDVLPGGARAERMRRHRSVTRVNRALVAFRGHIQQLREAIALIREIDDDYWSGNLANGPAGEKESTDADAFAERLYSQWPLPPDDLLTIPPGGAEQRSNQRCALWSRFWLLVNNGVDTTGWREKDFTHSNSHVQRRDWFELADATIDHGAVETAKKLRTTVRKLERTIVRELTTDMLAARTTLALAAGLGSSAAGDTAGKTTEPQAKELLALSQRLLESGPATAPAPALVTPSNVAVTLLALYIVQTVTEPVESAEVRCEFVQMSANVECPLDPSRLDAADKVAGLQLGHFGAFFKESWRANDWMWGRLDGAARLVAALVDPARVLRLFANAEEACDALREVAYGTGLDLLPDDCQELAARWQRAEPQILAELDALYTLGPANRLDALAETHRAIQSAFQLLIARDELPVVAAAAERSRAIGGALSPSAQQFVTDVRRRDKGNGETIPLKETRRLLARCDAGRESIRDEVGSDLLTATASTAAAVAAAAAAGDRSGLTGLRHLLASVRQAVLTVYLVAQNAVRRSKSAFALTQLLLAFGAGALAVKMLNGNVPTAVLAVAIPVLVAWVTITALTVGAWWALTPLVAAVVVVGWSSLDRCNAADAFGGPRICEKGVVITGQTTPLWRQTVTTWLPVLPLVLGAVSAWFYGHSWWHARRRLNEKSSIVRLNSLFRRVLESFIPLGREHVLEDDKEHATSMSDSFVRVLQDTHRPRRRALTRVGISIVIGIAGAIGLCFALRHLLNYRDHPRLINTTRWLHDYQPFVILVGLPLLFIALGLLREGARTPYVVAAKLPDGFKSKVRNKRAGFSAALASRRDNRLIRGFRDDTRARNLTQKSPPLSSRLPTRRTQWCHQFESEHPAFADLGPDLEPADSPIEHTDVRIRMQMIIRDAEGNLHRVGRAVLGGLPKLKRKERKAVTTIDRNNVEPAPYVSRDDPTEGA